jgi:hypothetical protein
LVLDELEDQIDAPLVVAENAADRLAYRQLVSSLLTNLNAGA